VGNWDGDTLGLKGEGFDGLGVYRPNNQVFYLENQICGCQIYGDTALTLNGRSVGCAHSHFCKNNVPYFAPKIAQETLDYRGPK
jgi:hypothetical protein